MKKVITIIILSVVVISLLSAGIVVAANYSDWVSSSKKYPDSWYTRENVAPAKTVSINGKEEQLTYEITNGSEEGNPLDVYRDENQNEYRYNQEGELDTYKQNFSNKVPAAEGLSVAEKEIVARAEKYLSELYGERANGFVLKSCAYTSAEAGYDVLFSRRYGKDQSIFGANALVIVRTNGDLGAATIAQDLMEDFDASRLANVTAEAVSQKAVAAFKAKNSASEVTNVSEVQLVREDGKFVLRTLITLQSKSGFEIKDVLYSEID